MIQGSDEWKSARLGRLTASRVAKAMARTKSGWGASRANLRAELVCERLTGIQQDTYMNAAMQWGVDHEPAARAAYEFYRDVDVTTVGFIAHPKILMSGASPDGLVGTDGLVEFKCPNTSTHMETLLGAPVADEYRKQVLWQMACTGRTWADLASFDPRLPPEMQLHVTRIIRDDAEVAELEAQAGIFLAEVLEVCNSLKSKYLLLEAA